MKKRIGWIIFALTLLTWVGTFFISYFPPRDPEMASTILNSGVILSIASLVTSAVYLFNMYDED